MSAASMQLMVRREKEWFESCSRILDVEEDVRFVDNL
jgi:hypothetical protein